MTAFLTVVLALAWAGCGPHPHVEAFLDRPTSFGIAVEGSTGLGTVEGARLVGDSLTIEYAYPAPEGRRTGRLVGTLAAAEFRGTYDTRGPGTHFEGQARLSFHAGGSATGTWNDGAGTVDLVQPQ